MGSYADTVREELLEIATKKNCCRKALSLGLLLTATAEEDRVSAEYRHGGVAEYAAKEFRRQFGKTPAVEAHASYGHTKWIVSFRSNTASNLLRECFSEDHHGKWYGFDCEGCRSAFLRGAFLACATVNDPKKSIHLEFLLQEENRASYLKGYLEALGYEPRVTNRQNGVGVYFKNAASLEDLVALIGAGKLSMEIMNFRIEREIRNQENRATNCVAKNIEKSVSAAARQMNAIEKLTVTGMLAQLPSAIRLTARLRAENPDASLEELRNLHVPPITKSGLNHRLQKILAEADKLD